MENVVRCKICIFWEEWPKNPTNGLCRHDTPKAGNIKWPQTKDTDWCGMAVSREIIFTANEV